MKFYGSWLDLVILVAFAGSVFWSLVERRKLAGDLKKLLPEIVTPAATTFLYLETLYWRNRSRIKSRELDLRVCLSFLMPLVTFALAVLCYQRSSD